MKRRFSIFRFLFALILIGGIAAGWCALQRENKFSLLNISNGLLIAAAVVFLYSLEFTHTLMGHQASARGSDFNRYHRVKANMDTFENSNRFVIPEYLIMAVLAAVTAVVLLLIGKRA